MSNPWSNPSSHYTIWLKSTNQTPGIYLQFVWADIGLSTEFSVILLRDNSRQGYGHSSCRHTITINMVYLSIVTISD